MVSSLVGHKVPKNTPTWYKTNAIMGVVLLLHTKSVMPAQFLNFRRNKKFFTMSRYVVLGAVPSPVFGKTKQKTPHWKKYLHMVTMVHACHGFYWYLWTFCACSAWQCLTGSWVTPIDQRCLNQARGGCITHQFTMAIFLKKTPSTVPPQRYIAVACGLSAPVLLDGAHW